jgi:hypothetical protein
VKPLALANTDCENDKLAAAQMIKAGKRKILETIISKEY